MTQTKTVDAGELRRMVADLLAANDPNTMAALDFLRARFDAGLAWVHFPPGLGGLGIPRALQSIVDAELAAAGAPDNDPRKIGIGLGMAAPTILAFGTEEQKTRFLRPLWTGEDVWCQLFSEPGAGSDLASLGTRAVRDGDDWVVTGQKVWTSGAHSARWAILVTRTDPDVPQHLGSGSRGPEGSAMKLTFARLAQQLSGLELELLGEDGLRYDDWTLRRPAGVDFFGRIAGYRYLRAKGNSIEGGTSEILRNIIAERVLGLPSEPRVDKDVAWKDLPR